MQCKVPETGITISPIGEIVLCCAGDNVPIGHISEIDDVTEFFNSEVYSKLRSDFKGGYYPSQCEVCTVHGDAGRITRRIQYNMFDFPTFEEDVKSEVIPIRYLEISTSNICNQMCVTCSGKYSSRWAPYEQYALDVGLEWRNENHKFHTEKYKMTKNDVEKILKFVPGLQHLTIKGGEPFADPYNIMILEKVAETNPKCRIEICTNLQAISQKAIEILHRIEDVHIQISVDGVGDLYNWIRGGNFDQVVKNIERYNAFGGRTATIVTTVSIYNWMNLIDIIDYFKDNKAISIVTIANIVTYPKYCSPLYLHERHINEGLTKIRSYLNENFEQERDYFVGDDFYVGGVENLKSVIPTLDEYVGVGEMHKRMIDWIDFSLIARQNDEDIFELVPYLNEYRGIPTCMI